MLPKYLQCPWCKTPMHLIESEPDDGHIRRGPERLRDYYYDCECCGAQSPNVYMVCTHEWAEARLAELCNITMEEEVHET